MRTPWTQNDVDGAGKPCLFLPDTEIETRDVIGIGAWVESEAIIALAVYHGTWSATVTSTANAIFSVSAP